MEQGVYPVTLSYRCDFCTCSSAARGSGLRLARNDGTFDSAGFGIKTAFLTMFPALKKQDEDLIEYKERKAKTRKSPFNLFLSGLVFLVLSLVLFVIYMTVKQSV